MNFVIDSSSRKCILQYMKTMKRLLRLAFRQGFHVTRDFDAPTRRALDLAAANAQAKRLARLAK